MSLIPTPDFPHFYYMLGGNLGSLLYGGVSVMLIPFYCSVSVFWSISFEDLMLDISGKLIQ